MAGNEMRRDFKVASNPFQPYRVLYLMRVWALFMSLQVLCVLWLLITCVWVTTRSPGSLLCSDPPHFPCVTLGVV